MFWENILKTVKIKPTSPDQGEYVVINESDFDPNIHKLCEGEKLDGVFKSNPSLGEPADLSALVPVEQFDAVALDLTNTKEQLATAQGEFIAFKNDVAAMQARIDELQPPTKKPTAAELKAAKAAEEAAKAEQSKE